MSVGDVIVKEEARRKQEKYETGKSGASATATSADLRPLKSKGLGSKQTALGHPCQIPAYWAIVLNSVL